MAKKKAPKLNKFQAMLMKDLLSLGGSADAVAAALKRKKILGTPKSDHSCPLANFLVQEYQDEAEVSIESIDVNGVSIHTPPHLAKFIKGFDALQYDELIDLDTLDRVFEDDDEREAFYAKRKKAGKKAR